MKGQLARVLRLPANQLRAVFPCLCSGLQSILTCSSVKLRDSSVYFDHSAISRANHNLPVLFSTQSWPTTWNSPQRSFDPCANKAAFQLQPTDGLLSCTSRHNNNNNLSGLVAVRLLLVLKCQKKPSTCIRTAEVTPDAESREEPDDHAAIPPPHANTTGEEPLNEAQPPITMDQITSIVSAIVESKLATLSSTPGRASAFKVKWSQTSMSFFLPSNHVPQLMLSSLNPTSKAIPTLILLLTLLGLMGGLFWSLDTLVLP